MSKLYFTRVAFSVLWGQPVVTLAKTHSTLATILFIIYPAGDAIAIFFDISANPPNASKTPQYINAGFSIFTTIAVIIALQNGISGAVIVFRVWAFLAGLIQLILGLRRRKYFEGQWPMIISGGQSMIAGVVIFAMAHEPNQGVTALAGYSAFGAFYFALAAFRLGKTINNAPATASAFPTSGNSRTAGVAYLQRQLPTFVNRLYRYHEKQSQCRCVCPPTGTILQKIIKENCSPGQMNIMPGNLKLTKIACQIQRYCDSLEGKCPCWF